ncbi:MAG: response regulator transcription factor [Phycisphaerae bacterium]|nr:response regulator transcription factor [Phycisphaerae bacterium]
MTKQPIRIFIADSNGLMRDALRLDLEKDAGIKVVGAASTFDEMARSAASSNPDVVVTSVAGSKPKEMSCFEAIGHVRQLSPATKFIIFTAFPPSVYLEQALAARVDGCVTKGPSSVFLADAIRDVVRGRLYFDLAVSRWLEPTDDYVRMKAEPTRIPSSLTPEEAKLLGVLSARRDPGTSRHFADVPPLEIDARITALLDKLGFHELDRLREYANREWCVDW